jgi:hypothetical protein
MKPNLRSALFPADSLIGGDMSEKKRVKQESTSVRDLSVLLKDTPAGAWVALSPDETRVLGFGNSMQAAAYRAQLEGEENPVLVKMPVPGEGLAAGVR